MNEYDKLQLEQRELNRKLDEIVVRKVREQYSGMRKSYVIHTPPEVLRNLGERNRRRY